MDEETRVVRSGSTSAIAEVKDTSGSRWTKAKRCARHTIAILFWSYVILKLFVLDVDEILVRQLLPGATWLVQYRGVVVLGVLAVLALAAWGLRLLGWVLYVLFYPLVVAVWHVPSFLIKRRAWILAVALLAATVSAVRSLRWTLILVGSWAVGALLIAAGVSGIPVAFGVLLLGFCLFIMYWRTIVDAFRSSIDMFPSQSLDGIWAAMSKGFTPAEEIRKLEVEAMTEAQRNMWVGSLQLSILYGRACYFVVDKLRNLHRGRITAAIAGVKVAGLFVATVVVFALASLGLYKIDHSQYVVAGVVRGFDFFWYAFQASFMSCVGEVAPIGVGARSLFMLNELTTGLILFVVVVFFVTGVQTSRNADQMDSLIRKIRDHGAVSEAFVKEQFGLTVIAAMEELTRHRAGMVSWILLLSPELDPHRSRQDGHPTNESR